MMTRSLRPFKLLLSIVPPEELTEERCKGSVWAAGIAGYCEITEFVLFAVCCCLALLACVFFSFLFFASRGICPAAKQAQTSDATTIYNYFNNVGDPGRVLQ